MPRAPCIDRTLTYTQATVLILNLKTRKSKEKTIYLVGSYQSDASLLRSLKLTWPDPNTVPVHVIRQESEKRSFHMTENEYINYIITKEKGAIQNDRN